MGERIDADSKRKRYRECGTKRKHLENKHNGAVFGKFAERCYGRQRGHKSNNRYLVKFPSMYDVWLVIFLMYLIPILFYFE